MIISAGVNIYPAEIEDALHRHPDIQDVAVFGVPDDEDVGFRERPVGSDLHLDHDRQACLALAEGCQVRRELLGKHEEDPGRGVHGRRVGPCVTVDGGTLPRDGVDVGDADPHRPLLHRFRDRELVEASGLIVVDGAPEEAAQVAGSVSAAALTTASVSANTAGEKSGSSPRWIFVRRAMALAVERTRPGGSSLVHVCAKHSLRGGKTGWTKGHLASGARHLAGGAGVPHRVHDRGQAQRGPGR